MLKKLDPLQPPSYPSEFFTPAPASGEKSGREKLTDDVAAAVRSMAEPAASATDYCPPIDDIVALATLTNTYFETGHSSNPALDDFKKDWVKVRQQAGFA